MAGPGFLQVKMKFNFYKKQVIDKSASEIFGLVRLIILSYNRQKKDIKRYKIIVCPHIMLTRYSAVQWLCNKQSGSVIFRPVRLIIIY